MPGWAAVQLDRLKNLVGGRIMLINESIPSSTTRPLFHSQPILISSNWDFLLRCPIANYCTSTTSTFLHVAVVVLVTTQRSRTTSATTKCRLLVVILISITPDGLRTQMKTKEANKQPTKSMQSITPFLSRIKLRSYRKMAVQLRPISVWPPMTSHFYQICQSPLHWPAFICTSSSPSTQNCPRFMGLGVPASASRKRTGYAMLKPATNTLRNKYCRTSREHLL